MGISKKLKMIKNNEYLIFKMKKTLLFFTAIINFIGFSFFVNAADVTINGSNSTDYTFDDEDTLTLKGPANASGKLNFNSGTISINSILIMVIRSLVKLILCQDLILVLTYQMAIL